MISNKDYRKRFEILYQLLLKAHLCFYVWKGLQKKEYEILWIKNTNFWNTVLFALSDSWLQALANIYEESKHSRRDEVISVYSLMQNQKDSRRKSKAEQIVSQNKTIIKNVYILRNNQLSHYNAKHLLHPKTILKKFPIKFPEVGELLGITGKLLHCLHPKSGYGFNLDAFNKESEMSSVLVMKRIAKCIELEGKYRDWMVKNSETFHKRGAKNFFDASIEVMPYTKLKQEK